MINRDFYKDFPTLQERDGKRVIYLDSGATTQKPKSVLYLVRIFSTGRSP